MPNVSVGVNKSDIWLCKKLTSTSWAEPIKLRLNVMPTNSDGDIFAYGKDYPQYLRIKCTTSESNLIKAEDRIYFRKIPPLVHNPTQNNPKEDTNYIVTAQPSVSLNVADIRLKYRTGY